MAFIGVVGAAAFFLSQSLVDRQYATKTKRNASTNKIRTTRKIHFSIRFINRNEFEVGWRNRSSSKRSGDTSLRLACLDWFQSFNKQPNTDRQFEQRHRRIENVVVHNLVEVREDEVDKRAEHTPRGRDYAKDRQSFRNVVRLPPQPGANRGGQSEERETDIIIIETSGDLHARQCLQAIRFENFQVTRVAEKPKRRQ